MISIISANRCCTRTNCAMCKEVNKEQPSYRNLSATATRVLQCTWPIAASGKDCSATGNYIVNMIRCEDKV